MTPQPPLTLRSGLKAQGELSHSSPPGRACPASAGGWGWVKTGTDCKSAPAIEDFPKAPLSGGAGGGFIEIYFL